MADKSLYLPEALLTDYQLGPSQKIVYAVMLANGDEDGICRMSAHQIGETCGMADAAAQSNRLKLCSLGYAELCQGTQRNYRLLKHLEERHGNG